MCCLLYWSIIVPATYVIFPHYNIVEPVLLQDLEYCHADSVEFEVCQPAKKDALQWFEIACRCEETQEPKPLEWPENDRVRISELEPGVQYTVKATAHYPNQQSVGVTKSFEIPKCDGKFPLC